VLRARILRHEGYCKDTNRKIHRRRDRAHTKALPSSKGTTLLSQFILLSLSVESTRMEEEPAASSASAAVPAAEPGSAPGGAHRVAGGHSSNPASRSSPANNGIVIERDESGEANDEDLSQRGGDGVTHSGSNSDNKSTNTRSNNSRSNTNNDDNSGGDRRAPAVSVFFGSVGEAANHLEENEGGTIDSLYVREPLRGRPDLQAFGRLVAALGRYEGGRVDRQVHFLHLDWDALPEEDVETLFGQVLPFHPTLKRLAFFDIEGAIPVRYLTLLTSSLPAAGSSSALKILQFMFPRFGRESSQAIADLIGRNVALTELVVLPNRHALHPDDCKLICEATLRHTSLQCLRLRVDEVQDDTLGGVGASSTLRTLGVTSNGGFSEGSVASFARQLRTNATLSHLSLATRSEMPRDDRFRLFRPIEKVLETHNFTLTQVEVGAGWDGQENVVSLLRRNRRIQRALEQLEPVSYRLEPTILWPRAFEKVSALPTLLYRFLRRGDVSALSDLLLRDKKVQGKKKRGRSSSDSDER
jgi:hypothetical protein